MRTPSFTDILDPELIQTVTGLELVAKIIVEGFMSGSNKSRTIGSGHEFSQYKNYEPGDDLRQLDWKLFTRSDRYAIKQSDIETNITVKFMLDASHSMAYEENKVSKFQYAKVLIAALASLARKQSDTVGLYTINNKNISVIQPRFEHQQFTRFLAELVAVKPDGSWGSDLKTESLFDHHGKEIIIFLTDMYDENQDIQHFIKRLKTKRNEVIVFHLMGRREIDFSYDGTFSFEDLETGNRIQANSTVEQETYRHRIQKWLQSCKNWMLEKQISYQLIILDTDPNEVLRNFLNTRKRMIR